MEKLIKSKNLIILLGIMVAILATVTTLGAELPQFNRLASVELEWPAVHHHIHQVKALIAQVMHGI